MQAQNTIPKSEKEILLRRASNLCVFAGILFHIEHLNLDVPLRRARFFDWKIG